jgi:uncharacterized protein DUF11
VVTSAADSGSGTIRDALASAAPGDTISIPSEGDYQVTTAELAVTKDVTITGSGPGVRLVSDGNNRVFDVTASNVTISDLSIVDGEVVGDGAEGGGVFNGSGNLTLRNVVVRNNSLVSSDGSVSGAGVFNSTGDLQISGSTIESNAAEIIGSTGGFVSGGAVGNDSGHVTITGSIVIENSTGGGTGAAVSGGGISSTGGRLDVVDSTVESNEALGDAEPAGGGIITEGTTVNVTGSTVDGNSAVSTGNQVGGLGGGMVLHTGSGTISDSTITNNVASGGSGGGGGLFVADNTVEATNVTIASNSARGAGSGGANLFVASLGDGQTTFKPLNTIVADGTADGGGNCALSTGTSIVSQGHNLDSGNGCGFNAPGDLVNTEPRLGALRGNGGVTETLAPAPDSPVIDAGANSGCPAMDQRGVSRPQDGICDIGAFEQVFSSDVSASLSGAPRSVPVGVPFKVTLEVSDSGPDAAADDLAVSNLMPRGARLVSATAPQGSCSPSSCVLGGLAPGAHATVALTLLPTKPGVLSHAFGISSRRPDPSPASASMSVRVTPLALTGLSTSHHRFRFKLSAPARVTFTFARRAKGHLVKKFAVRAKAGTNAVRFKGRFPAGTYRVTATAHDAFGNKSKPRRLTLRLLDRSARLP